MDAQHGSQAANKERSLGPLVIAVKLYCILANCVMRVQAVMCMHAALLFMATVLPPQPNILLSDTATDIGTTTGNQVPQPHLAGVGGLVAVNLFSHNTSQFNSDKLLPCRLNPCDS